MAQSRNYQRPSSPNDAGRRDQPPSGQAAVTYPLPGSTSKLLLASPTEPRKDIHPGLMIGKLAPWFPVMIKVKGEGKPKRVAADALPLNAGEGIDRDELFKAVVRATEHPDRKRLHQSWSKRWNATASELGATVRKFRGEFEVVLWLASPSAADLGFCLHHTYGLPYLPASGLKGLARAYSEYVAAEAPERAATIRETAGRAFGPLLGEDESDAARAGSVVFLDGILDPSSASTSPLELDVMTPHHSSYYTGTNPWPHDCESPVPLPFLRMRRGLRFDLAIAPRDPASAGAVDDVTWAWEMLEGGLRVLGLGAKTSAGYGVLVRDGSAPVVAAVGPVKPSIPDPAPRVPGKQMTGRIVKFVRGQDRFSVESQGKQYRVAVSEVVKANSKVLITDVQRWFNLKTLLTFEAFDDGTARNVAPKEG